MGRPFQASWKRCGRLALGLAVWTAKLEPGLARGRGWSSNRVRDMAKKITGYIKLQVPAGAANPSPPIGPALGQRGVNIMEFCKAFNAKTAQMDPDLKIPVVITVYADRSFTFETKTPPAADLLKKAAGISKGSGKPNREKVGTISKAKIEEIARTKIQDLNTTSLAAAIKTISGTARQMGLTIE